MQKARKLPERPVRCRMLAACLAFGMFLCPVSAAEFKFTPGSPPEPGSKFPGLSLIELSGQIMPGDDDIFRKFQTRALPLFTGVILDSTGGDVAAALTIGRELHALGWSTLVKKGAVCASACA